ncbi:MAG TPA: RidA family protein [Thermoanaerobaculia bacterium]|nr:RidA family protein [Thermoanaerobaculia bacterium]HUM29074.1 RidA family protein [Thermoanaerobaculia bacterium]HXK67370.1 RidA family protein [Thermoanaerobaculia bacterium]
MKTIQTDRAPRAIGPYSQAVEMSRWIFTSGQIALHPETGKLVNDSFAQEVQQVLANLKAVLEAGGCRVKDVLKTTVFLDDMANFAEFNGIYEAFMEGHKPARSTIQVAGLPLGVRIEIEAIAVIP